MFKLSHWRMKNRTLLLGLFPALVMFILLVSLFFWQRINDVNTEMEGVGNILSSQLVASIEYPVISGNYELLKPLVESASKASSVVKVSIENSEGQVLFEKIIEGYDKVDPSSIEVYTRALVQEQEEFDEFSEFDGIVHEPVAKNIAYVKLELSYVLGRDRALQIAFKSMGWASIILLFCLLLAHRMAKSIAKPIEQVSQSLSRIAGGELNSEIEVTAGAEIGELQKGVNTMARALKQSDRNKAQAILDLEMSRKKAEEADKAKGEFLAVVSHELRTPINGAMGAVQLMEAQKNDDNECYLEIADRSLSNLLELVEDMLTLGTLENKEQPIEILSHHIPKLLMHTMSDLQEKSEQNQNQLNVYLDSAVNNRMIKLDGIKFRQLVRHLLGNAIKFTRNGNIYCSIYIDSFTTKDILRLDISDNGVGFPEEYKGFMYEPFTQCDSSLSRAFEGLGIGLTICYDIIQLLDGRLEIRDNTPKGTIVHCSIPVTVIADDNEEGQQKEQQSLEQKSIKALLVEDNQVNRLVAEKILQNMNVETVSVESGKECLEQYRSAKFDVIFMDCQMPDMDGFETTRAIRTFENLSKKPPVPIIALTANTTENVREDCKNAGMTDYIAKPIKVEILKEVVNKWL
jgi:signal transduction histidine kinase/CheY-like chemotaxis protein